MQPRLPEGNDRVWSPCTNGRSIATYLARLQLPPTYQDIRERWKSLGCPPLDTLIQHSTFDSEGRGHDGDLDTIIAGQKNFLKFTMNTSSTLGIVLPKRKFEDVALYIHVRAEIEAELDVKEYGWSDLVRRNLYSAYWRRSLSSTDIDHAPCRAAHGAHTCLYKEVWGEMGSMTSEEIFSRFEDLYGARGSASSSVTSTWLTDTPSPCEQGEDRVTNPHETCFVDIRGSPLDGCKTTDDLSLGSWKDRVSPVLDPSLCHSLGTSSVPAQEDFLVFLTNELLRFAGTPQARDDGDVSQLQAEKLQGKPKRQRLHRRATSDTVIKGNCTSKGKRRGLGVGNAFVGDMMSRFADTYDRFDKSGVAEASLHTRLGEIFSAQRKGSISEDGTTTLLSPSPKRTKRASKRIWSSDENQLCRLGSIAEILNSLSQELSNSRSVVELGARDIQNLSMSSVLRYQHALLDTWHLYRERWAYLIEVEEGSSVSPTPDVLPARPISTLIKSLSSEQKADQKDAPAVTEEHV